MRSSCVDSEVTLELVGGEWWIQRPDANGVRGLSETKCSSEERPRGAVGRSGAKHGARARRQRVRKRCGRLMAVGCLRGVVVHCSAARNFSRILSF